MKIFGVSSESQTVSCVYGIECGVIIAESKEEAYKLVKQNPYFDNKVQEDDIFEIPFEKGSYLIASYEE